MRFALIEVYSKKMYTVTSSSSSRGGGDFPLALIPQHPYLFYRFEYILIFFIRSLENFLMGVNREAGIGPPYISICP